MAEGGDEQKKVPPRPPRSFIGSTSESSYEEPAEVYTEEEAEQDAQAEMETSYDEDTYDEENPGEPQEAAETYDEAPESESDTMPGFSLEELLADDEATPPPEEGESEDVSYATAEAYCVWEPENDCPILKAGNTEITTDQCIICQLIQIKQMLQNR